MQGLETNVPRGLRNQCSKEWSTIKFQHKFRHQCSSGVSESNLPKKMQNSRSQKGSEINASSTGSETNVPQKTSRNKSSRKVADTTATKQAQDPALQAEAQKPVFQNRITNQRSKAVFDKKDHEPMLHRSSETRCETRSFIKRRHSPFMANVHSMNPSSKCI